jgi:hypothetical protein
VNKDSMGSGLLYGGDSQTLCDLKRRGRSSPFRVHTRVEMLGAVPHAQVRSVLISGRISMNRLFFLNFLSCHVNICGLYFLQCFLS